MTSSRHFVGALAGPLIVGVIMAWAGTDYELVGKARVRTGAPQDLVIMPGLSTHFVPLPTYPDSLRARSTSALDTGWVVFLGMDNSEIRRDSLYIHGNGAPNSVTASVRFLRVFDAVFNAPATSVTPSITNAGIIRLYAGTDSTQFVDTLKVLASIGIGANRAYTGVFTVPNEFNKIIPASLAITFSNATSPVGTSAAATGTISIMVQSPGFGWRSLYDVQYDTRVPVPPITFDPTRFSWQVRPRTDLVLRATANGDSVDVVGRFQFGLGK